MDIEERVKIGVLGKNLSAALALEKLLQKNSSSSELHWFQYAYDKEERSKNRWFYSPGGQSFEGHLALNEQDVAIFLDGKMRLSLNAFLNLKDRHPSLIQKIYGAAFWNDLSPSPWKQLGEPDPFWTEKTSVGWRLRESWRPALIPLHHSLLLYEEKFRSAGVQVSPADKVVLTLKEAEEKNLHTLVHNAPYEVSHVNKICCFDSDFQTKRPAASWKTHVFRTRRSAVTALPTFSIYLDASHGHSFWQYGLLESGAIRRVLKLPDTQDHCWLQIESLEFAHTPEAGRLRPRLDSFLWNLCPFLQEEDIRFQNIHNTEATLFEDLEPLAEKIRPGAVRFYLGSHGRNEDLRLDGIL